MKEIRYFVKDEINTDRPIMGALGVYCRDNAMCREYGMTTEAEAQALCDMLNRGEIEYEDSEYYVLALEIMDPDEEAKLYADLEAYLAEHYRPAEEPAPADDELFKEAEQDAAHVTFEDFKKSAEEWGGFDPDDKDWFGEVVAAWALGQIPVVWAYSRDWSDGATGATARLCSRTLSPTTAGSTVPARCGANGFWTSASTAPASTSIKPGKPGFPLTR